MFGKKKIQPFIIKDYLSGTLPLISIKILFCHCN